MLLFFSFHNKILSVIKLLFANGSWSTVPGKLLLTKPRITVVLSSKAVVTQLLDSYLSYLKEQSQHCTPEYPLP